MPRNLKVYLLLLLFTITVLSPLFFYHLGQSSLASWDEAWYAAISKNILLSNNLLDLKFNGQPFADHPPAGFWLMAASMKIVGSDEFAVRLPSAICGISTLVLVFLIGMEITSPAVGLASAVALSSFPWFISRARSGNLDIPLTFFFVLTFYLATGASRNRRFLIPFGISLAFLLLTKTLVPFAIIPSLFIIFWNSSVISTKEMFYSITIAVAITASWFISQLINFPHFLGRYFSIGLPQSQSPSSLWQNLNRAKSYLHFGIGAWFRPIILSLPLLLFIRKPSDIRYLISVILFIFVFLTPFAFSSRGQIWHLIPVFPFLIITSLTVFYSLIAKKSRRLAASLTLTLTLTISVPQISYVSDEAILSGEASRYPYPLTIDDRFLPVAVYYSGKTVIDGSAPDIDTYFDNSNPTLLITHQWRLDQAPSLKSRYRILKTDRDMALILITANP
jgi:4-amino-4-deoxy-L-arabinose transferase-like glycosyltransferase